MPSENSFKKWRQNRDFQTYKSWKGSSSAEEMLEEVIQVGGKGNQMDIWIHTKEWIAPEMISREDFFFLVIYISLKDNCQFKPKQ